VEALSFGFMQRALIACVAVCAAAPLVGAFVVQRRQSLIGDGIGHVAFAGVGLAFLLGVNPLLGAAAMSILAAVALFRLERRGRLGGDLSLALLFYGGIALGYLFTQRAGGGLNAVVGFLFGSPNNISWSQVWWMIGLCALVAATVIALYGPLVSISFDEPAARVSGVPTDGVMLALTVVVALIVVGGMQALGVLLIAGMMVIPVAAASQLARSYRGTMVGGSLIGVFSAVTGVLVAYYADTSTGAAIVLVAICCHGVATGLRPVARRYATRVA
jgi:zinc transport system permease protein